MCCQMYGRIRPSTNDSSAVAIATKRLPEKKPRNSGNCILWKRLKHHAARMPQIRPPKTPICRVGIPTTIAYFPPCPAISGVMPSTVLMVMLVTNTETAADSAAMPDSEARPTAEPMANSIGRLSKIIPPAFIISGRWNLSPNASSKPAAGRSEIGSISARPIIDNLESDLTTL